MSARALLNTTTRALPALRSLTRASPSLLQKQPYSSKPPSPAEANDKSDTAAPTIEQHKQDSLAKQKQGKAHWKPELASESEASVKADRTPHEGGKDIGRLQEKTKGWAEEAKKGSMRDGF